MARKRKLAAARAGKHMLVEKPLVTVEEAAERSRAMEAIYRAAAAKSWVAVP